MPSYAYHSSEVTIGSLTQVLGASRRVSLPSGQLPRRKTRQDRDVHATRLRAWESEPERIGWSLYLAKRRYAVSCIAH